MRDVACQTLLVPRILTHVCIAMAMWRCGDDEHGFPSTRTGISSHQKHDCRILVVHTRTMSQSKAQDLTLEGFIYTSSPLQQIVGLNLQFVLHHMLMMTISNIVEYVCEYLSSFAIILATSTPFYTQRTSPPSKLKLRL